MSLLQRLIYALAFCLRVAFGWVPLLCLSLQARKTNSEYIIFIY